eukprot:Plantae.Rhodophyta-Purpureofilum_apyrenoidigerum.ctg56922.p1 GENE.Plantae.Rhodophyta-Purpureofilum_apyrenoidigerum.ctg56922~~Plantae.Rhodophyta-Purpureofilum_apyrenoidigerum.ctg56922.p1  ORF type:complete len:285 (-),score=35.08 Plantae.Rhodophyta-Purpureofilum_apyrenoidigerum.ctg56922:24-806(-)
MALTELPSDVVWNILLRLDGSSLARLQCVDKRWQDYAGRNELWLKMLQRRYNVTRVQNRHLNNCGEIVWKQVYANWLSIRRMPSSPYSGQRSPVMARNRDKDVFAWVTVRPSENCLLVNGRITLKIIIQNVRAEPTTISTDDVCITCKREPSIYPADWTLNVFQTGKCFESFDSYIRLNLYDFVVLQIAVPVPSSCTLEPEALERFASAQIRICRGTGQRGQDKCLDLLRCDFIESTIWDHYERLPGGFWVFLEKFDRSM